MTHGGKDFGSETVDVIRAFSKGIGAIPFSPDCSFSDQRSQGYRTYCRHETLFH